MALRMTRARGIALLAFLCVSTAAAAQGQQQNPQNQQKPSLQGGKAPAAAPQNATPPPPVNAEEEAAYKAFFNVKPDQTAQKAQLGEEFLEKYPQSRYLAAVYSALTHAYFLAGQPDKMQAAGEKALELNPNDLNVMAMLAQTLPRTWNPGRADAATLLAKAETYAKKTLDAAPALPKPEAMTDESFLSAKNQLLAMAHSGLGLVYFHRQKFAESVPEFEQSVKLVPEPDPVNYYLLGISEENTSHFADAVTAFNKCAEIQWQLQARCKAGAEDAKKRGATELSAPK